jgi:hypothetical protein
MVAAVISASYGTKTLDILMTAKEFKGDRGPE